MKKSIESQTINALTNEETKFVTGGQQTITLESVTITPSGGDGTDENASGGCGRDVSSTKMVSFDPSNEVHARYADLNRDLFESLTLQYRIEDLGFSVNYVD